MLRFLRGEADVLVCTSIIESGIDIPQANTLIVERADLFGLVQLYQIRGRVGRVRERAYAYLLYPSAAALTEEATQAPGRAQRLHRARRRLQDRDARPRAPRRRQPARRRAVRPRRGARLRALHADARRGGRAPEAEGEAPRTTRRAGAPRRQRRRLRPGRLHPLRAGEDRRAPPDRGRARGRRPRACCATSSRTASARCPSRWRNLHRRCSRRASSSARRARARSPSAAAGWPSRRSSSTPARPSALREADPGRAVRVRQEPALAARARRPGSSASPRSCAPPTRCSP